ncbi:UNVERIFIED_CONTAM: hypothetical protein Sindi_1729200 [Sesamum indicum]
MPTFAPIAFQNLLEPDSLKKPSSRNGGPRHLYISPVLYATPEQAPIPECSPPEPLSPSPYLVKHKRRRGGIERKVGVSELPSEENGGLTLEEVGENFVKEDLVGEEDEGVFDPRSEAVSEGSELEACDLSRNQIESQSFVSAQGEFFDAIDAEILDLIVDVSSKKSKLLNSKFVYSL